MASPQAGQWEPSGDSLESEIVCPDRDLSLLLGPHRLNYGEADLERGSLRVRIGRRPIALNIANLYRRRGRQIPDEYSIYEGHRIWLFNHSVGILRGEGMLDASHVHCEIEFADQRAVITEVLPQPAFIRPGPGGLRCEAEIRLNGRAVPAPNPETPSQPVENLYFGVQMSQSLSEDTVGRISFPVITPNVQAAGAGDASGEWILERAGPPISGDQTMIELLLLDKHARRLKCKVRVSASVKTFFGFPLRIKGSWVELDVELV